MRRIPLLVALASTTCNAAHEARQLSSSGIIWQTSPPSSASYAPSSNPSTSSGGYAPSYASVPASPSSSACASPCQNYESILLGCQHDAAQYNVWKSCVCNDANFQSYSQQCVTCEGTGSAPAQFQQNCQSVPSDCTTACSLFGNILSGCGDASDAGYENCVCSAAYDPVYTTTFNQAFNDCVVCEKGGGQAAEWEERCCKAGHGCNGLPSGSASGGGGGGPSSTSPGPLPGPSSSGFAMGRMEGFAWTPLFAGFALGLV